MFKLVAILAIIAIVAAHPPPNPEKMKAAMKAAGVSDAGITAISNFFETHKPSKDTNRETMRAEMEAFVATLSDADKTAFASMKKGGHRQKRRAAKNTISSRLGKK